MMKLTGIEGIQLICAASIPLSIIGLVIERSISKNGIGVRAVQFVAIASFMPSIIILALSNKIDNSTISVLAGAILGYIFSNIPKLDAR